MIPRLTLLFLMLVALALGPVRNLAECGAKARAVSCHGCCAGAAGACCTISGSTEPATPPGPTTPAADYGKQLLAPDVIFLGLSLAPAVERPAMRKLQAARLPVVARLDLICLRLI